MKDDNNKEPAITPPDNEVLIRCPKLGHQIYFSYCRQENLGAPCVKTLDCWYPLFPVEKYLRVELTPREWADVFEKPREPKIQTLLELINQAEKLKAK